MCEVRLLMAVTFNKTARRVATKSCKAEDIRMASDTGRAGGETGIPPRH